MDAYALDLRKKIVEAKERGMPTVEVAPHVLGSFAQSLLEGRDWITAHYCSLCGDSDTAAHYRSTS